MPECCRFASSNHLGLNIDGSIVSTETVDVTPEFNDGNLWTAWIDYNGTTLEVRVSSDGSRPALPTWSTAIDLPTLLGGTPMAFVGFTAATGSAVETTDIVSWTFINPGVGLLNNDTDPDTDPLTVTAYTDPTDGTVIVQPDGSFVYTPNPGFVGSDSFEYTVRRPWQHGHGDGVHHRRAAAVEAIGARRLRLQALSDNMSIALVRSASLTKRPSASLRTYRCDQPSNWI